MSECIWTNRNGLAASARIDRFLDNSNVNLQVGEEVELIIYQFTDLGAKVIINGPHAGLLFKNELYGRPELGSRHKGHVKKVRDDKKIDVP